MAEKKMYFKDIHLMKCPACLPDINPTENLWRILSRNVYIIWKLRCNKDEIWNASLEAVQFVLYEETQRLIKSLDERLKRLISEHEALISY